MSLNRHLVSAYAGLDCRWSIELVHHGVRVRAEDTHCQIYDGQMVTMISEGEVERAGRVELRSSSFGCVGADV